MNLTKLAIDGVNLLPVIKSLYETEVYNPLPDYKASIITSMTYKPIQIDILTYKEGLKSYMGVWDFSHWNLTPTQTFDEEELLSELQELHLTPRDYLFGTQGILLRTNLTLECTPSIWVRTNNSEFTCKQIINLNKGLLFTYIKGL